MEFFAEIGGELLFAPAYARWWIHSMASSTWVPANLHIHGSIKSIPSHRWHRFPKSCSVHAPALSCCVAALHMREMQIVT